MGGKNSGLIQFDPRREQFTSIKLPAKPSDYLDLSIYDILADPDGSIWIGTSNSGLLRYWPTTRQFEVYTLESLLPPGFTGRNATGSLYLDKVSQTFWFGSVPLGVCRLDKRTKQITSIPLLTPKPASQYNEWAMDIFQDKSGAVWVANIARGLFRYKPQTHDLTHVVLRKTPSEDLQLQGAFLDQSGIIWAPIGRGVVRYSQTREQSVRRYPIQNLAGKPITGARRVEQDSQGDYWLEFADRLARYDTTRRAIVETIPFPTELMRLGLKRIQVNDQQVFLHAYTGLYILNPKNRRIEPLSIVGKEQTMQRMRPEEYNRHILPDTIAGHPVLWIGTFEQGLLRYWVSERRVERISLDKGEWAAQNETVLRDRQKTIWIATNGQGLFRLDNKQTGKATQFLAKPNDPLSLPDNEITDLIEDYRGILWAATLTHGLVRINQQHGKVTFTTFAQFPDGPPSRIFSFFEDRAHLFWVTAGDGLYVFNPITGRFLKYSVTDQLLFRPDREALSRSTDGFPLTVEEGDILKGSDASAMFTKPRNPPLHFTDFRIFNKSHPELLANSSPIQLVHGQNQFSIEFAAPWFQHPEQIRYRYQLVGFDPGWTEIDTRREAFYTNIPHGQYTFRVQASWDGTNYFSRTIELPIIVVPAYWETWWFMGLVALVLGLIVWAFWSYRQREASLKSNLLLAQAEKRQRETELRENNSLFQRRLADTEMTALRAQMNPHFIFNCLNSIKLYTLQNDTDKASDYLTKFARLIRIVLENSRAERVPLKNELESLQLYSDLEAMRFKDKVTIHIRVEPDIDQQFISIPPLLLQPYVENAIWHGLMHKPEGGTVLIDVTQPDDQCLHIEITDDGIGRARANQLKSKSAGKQKSFGMQVTAERIRMINALYNTHNQASILDLVTHSGESLGTKVVLEIPI